ncbi:glycoside hydrolase family 15 protein [Streptomyces sp. TLI_171]|uniref:glycoside hydrolase family 15 protein n=1 Tax=Streptomyces sp. TLI_171 TaxID=1938859 RepID=UPI000C18B8E2|nr:glycoside hydrolase family 15 protein [Streptomyces sp. TLI_171]RKE17503.1 GH15 family glucan-1,4-alpha-glucosidase [Streptomyces sp. TLI_171]
MPAPPPCTPPAPHVLRDYALLADGHRGALLGPDGDLVWMCAPRWDSDAVLAALIGGPGWYSVTPTVPHVPSGRYEEGGLIRRSRWTTRRGVVECREALARPGRPDRAVLLRRILAVEGRAELAVSVHLAGGFGTSRTPPPVRDDAGRWSLRTGPLHGLLTGLPDARPGPCGGLHAVLRLPAGAQHDLVLDLGERAPDAPSDPDRAWAATEAAWAADVPGSAAFAGLPGGRDARHAHAVLTGLTGPDGGTVAAATTSLPEQAEQGRNYDYRYVWIRDQAYIGQAFAAAGPHPVLAGSARFVAARLLADGPRLAPAYTVRGEPVPDLRSLELPGYPGGFDVVGNRVRRQFQLDVFGESLLLFAAAAEHGLLDADGRRAAGIAADAIAARHGDPDAGIWEIHPDRWTHSRLTCAAGLRAAAAALHRPDWLPLAERLTARALVDSRHPSGRWQRSPTDPAVDAALLLPALRGAVPADAPPSRATLAAVLSDLADDHFCYRFRHRPGPLADAEGAFLLCGFLVALSLHRQHRLPEAYRWFERNRAACGPAGLYAEEYDVALRQLRGNLPQAFVHAVLLETATRLAEPPDRS